MVAARRGTISFASKIWTVSPRWLRVSLRTLAIPASGPRAGRHDLLDFAYDLEDIARPRRLRPTDLAAGADDPAHERQSRLDQQAHGDRRRMPAASVPVPTFVSLCSTRSYERRNQRDTSNYVIPVWLRI